MSEEITADNFSQYFFDIKRHKPQPGQVMARYLVNAELMAGDEKLRMIQTIKESPLPAVAYMRNVFRAVEPDSYRIPKEIAEDLLNGMTEEEVNNKPYKFLLEMFYYTKEEYVPKDNPHWSVISLMNLDEFLKWNAARNRDNN